MFNQVQKNMYLDSITNENSQKAIHRIFNATEDLEESLGKDLCSFNKKEMLYLLQEKTGTGDISNAKSLLSSYISWCIHNGYNVNISYSLNEITQDDINKSEIYRRKFLLNEEELNEMLNIVFNENDASYEESVDKPKELIIRLCYLGLENNEIVHLKKDMIDYNEHIIFSSVYPDIYYEASDRILDLCKYCSNQTSVIYNSTSGKQRTEELCDNNYILRKRIGTAKSNSDYNEPLKNTTPTRRVKDLCRVYNERSGYPKDLTPDKIRESALFHCINKSSNKDSLINDSIKTELLLRKPNLEQNTRQLYDKIRNIKKTYKAWADAFEFPEIIFQHLNTKTRNKEIQSTTDVFDEILRIYKQERKQTKVSQQQYIRNRNLVNDVKNQYHCRCQLCKSNEYFDIQMDDAFYVEVHHIIPNCEGEDEEGSLDRPNNMIVVCPNHHKYLHYNKGGKYKLVYETDALYLANSVDKIKVENDFHLRKHRFDI